MIKRVVKTDGVSGVIVSLLLILIGIISVVGVKEFMFESRDSTITEINSTINSVNN